MERAVQLLEASRSRGEGVAEQGKQVSVAAGGLRKRLGRPGAQTERRGGVRERRYCVVCLGGGGGGDCRSKVNAAEPREAAGSQKPGKGPRVGAQPGWAPSVSSLIQRPFCGFPSKPSHSRAPIAQ